MSSTPPPPLTRPDGTPISVLTVDDERSVTELLSMAMRYEGWEVATAASGLEAVQAARTVRPDAIVLDMMLPDFDGLEVMRRIRTEQPDVPVIFLTARDAMDDRVGGLTAGGDDEVTKPSRSKSSSRGCAGCCGAPGRRSCAQTRSSSSATSSSTRTATRSAAPARRSA